MEKQFLRYLKDEKLWQKGEHLLVAASAGVDSTVLCELLSRNKISFSIAHCNFQLRAQESDADEDFAESLAEKYGVPFHVTSFDTRNYADTNGISLQMAARQLRYEWFEELCRQFDYSSIATAHHSDDSVETFFIHLIRGTGIRGLHGILPKQGRIIRPLLFTSKEEILQFAKKNKIIFREDSSNASDKYLRNNIRLKLIPLLQNWNPSIRETVAEEIKRFGQIEQFLDQELEDRRKKLVTRRGNQTLINLQVLLTMKPLELLLFELLRPFGFRNDQIDSIAASLSGIPGKQWTSKHYELTKDRKHLILQPISKKEIPAWIKITQNMRSKKLGTGKWKMQIKSGVEPEKLPRSANIACLDLQKLEFPLVLRQWKAGDSFQPFGMKGKKKVSDFLIDKKISRADKDNTYVLCSGDTIVWLIGHRIDERFKVQPGCKKIYFVSVDFDVTL